MLTSLVYTVKLHCQFNSKMFPFSVIALDFYVRNEKPSILVEKKNRCLSCLLLLPLFEVHVFYCLRVFFIKIKRHVIFLTMWIYSLWDGFLAMAVCSQLITFQFIMQCLIIRSNFLLKFLRCRFKKSCLHLKMRFYVNNGDKMISLSLSLFELCAFYRLILVQSKVYTVYAYFTFQGISNLWDDIELGEANDWHLMADMKKMWRVWVST